MRELLLKIMELSSSHLEQLRITVFKDFIVIELMKPTSRKELKITPEFLVHADPVTVQQALELELTKLYQP